MFGDSFLETLTWVIGAGLGVVAALVVILWAGRPILSIASKLIKLSISAALAAVLTGLFPLNLVFNRITPKQPFRRLAEKITNWVGGFPFDPRAAAEAIWPPSRFPELYQVAPADLERPPWEDGRLVGGVPIAQQIDRFYSRELLDSALYTGSRIASAALLGGLVLAVGAGLWGGGAALPRTAAPAAVPESEYWGPGFEVQAEAAAGPGLLEYGRAGLEAVGHGGKVALTGAAASVALALAVFFFLPSAMVDREIEAAGRPWRRQTKDARTRFKLRSESRRLARAVYRAQLALSDSRLASTPVFKVGEATGFFRYRGDLNAPIPGQAVALDRESLHQHLIAFGGTGEGKTSAILKPLARQILSQTEPRYGMFALDAKAVLWRDLEKVAAAVGRADDVIVVGTGAGQAGINPLGDLEPADLADTAKSLLDQAGGGGGGKDDFWNSMAATAIKHAAVLAREIQILTGENKYTLPEIYKIATDDEYQKNSINKIVETSKKQGKSASETIQHSLDYLIGPWANLNPSTKTSILASIIKLLDPLVSSPDLCARFGGGGNLVPVSAALDGKILLFAISSLEHGLAGRFLLMLAKTAFYRCARLRELREGSDAAQKKPVAVLIDEAQELLTADASGVSDGSFWNVARSAGVAGIIGTQTVAALYQALGEKPTANLIQQFRSKVFLRTEDKASHEMAGALAGEQLRALAFEEGQRESLEARQLIDGFITIPKNANDVAALARKFQDREDSPVELALAGLRFVLGTAEPNKQALDDYHVDKRFVPKQGLIQHNDNHLTALQAAFWRQEDLDRQYLTAGNEMRPVLQPADILAMGRWHAFAHIQRAGGVRQDLIQIRHEF